MECGSKKWPERQIICDECQKIYHLECHRPPLEAVPPEHEQWFCSNCKNHDCAIIAQHEQALIEKCEQLNQSKNWGRGVSCVGRATVPQIGTDHFGPVPGVEVGTWWHFRVQASETGVHTPLVAGICGRENCGAISIVVSCQYDLDVDLGDEIYYTGSGGRDPDRKGRVGGAQTRDQELRRCNKALAMNCYAEFNDVIGGNSGDRWQLGKPVRVLRSGNARGAQKRSLYLPRGGVRYDGIYKVVKYWPEKGHEGHVVWRFLLRRDDPSPAPWTKKVISVNFVIRYHFDSIVVQGKARLRRLGLNKMITIDEAGHTNRKRALPAGAFQLPPEMTQLLDADVRHGRLWTQLTAQRYSTIDVSLAASFGAKNLSLQ